MPQEIPQPPPVVVEPLKDVKRTVQYYDLLFEFLPEFVPKENEEKFLGFFSIISKMAKDKDRNRYVPTAHGSLFVQEVLFNDVDKTITGKLRMVRTDVFPELMDMITDETSDIEAAESKGLVETTHFVISYAKPLKKIAIEYNHTGAKIADFVTYCQFIGELNNALRSANAAPISKNELKKLKDRIGNCSMLTVRIHKDNIAAIENIDNKLFSSLEAIQDQYTCEYLELRLRFKYRKIKKAQPIQTTISHIINSLVGKKNNLGLFETLKINALDKHNADKMRIFDLLVDKIESEIVVQRKPKHKVLVSIDAFEKIKNAMKAQHL